jgi:glycosyltransferase involved in cell wall biosynthesis
LLGAAIDSVLAQDVRDFECIVVDDDGSASVQVPNDKRVRVIAGRGNAGAAATRNRGIDEARGRYITFLDDDDLYTPDRLSLALEGLSRAPASICWMRYLDAPSDDPSWKRVLEGRVHNEILEQPVPHVGTCAMDRSAVVRFDESFKVSEDVEWWLRLSVNLRVVTVPRVGYLLRRHAEHLQTSRIEERLRARLALLESHADYFATRPRAAAYHLKRAGGFAQVLGYHSLAREAFGRSLRLHRRPETIWHLVRSLRTTKTSRIEHPELLEIPAP